MLSKRKTQHEKRNSVTHLWCLSCWYWWRLESLVFLLVSVLCVISKFLSDSVIPSLEVCAGSKCIFLLRSAPTFLSLLCVCLFAPLFPSLLFSICVSAGGKKSQNSVEEFRDAVLSIPACVRFFICSLTCLHFCHSVLSHHCFFLLSASCCCCYVGVCVHLLGCVLQLPVPPLWDTISLKSSFRLVFTPLTRSRKISLQPRGWVCVSVWQSPSCDSQSSVRQAGPGVGEAMLTKLSVGFALLLILPSSWY